MRRIAFQPDDSTGANRLAAHLLRDAAVLRETSDGGLEAGYRAAWVGTPAALGMLAVHRDVTPREAELGAVLLGRNVRDGRPKLDRIQRAVEPGEEQQMGDAIRGSSHRQVVREAVTFGLPLFAPAEVTREWREAGAERQAQIEQAMIAAADAALEHIRTARPLLSAAHAIHGRDTYVRGAHTSYADGIAGFAAVRAPAERGSGGDPRLRVEVVIVGVQHASGGLAPPDVEALEATLHGAEQAANRRLAAELSAQRTVTVEDRWRQAEEDLAVMETRAALQAAGRQLASRVSLADAATAQRERVAQLREEVGAIGEPERAPAREEPPPGVPRIGREDVSVRPALETVQDVIRQPLAAQLAERTKALASWVEQQPDEWVQRRHAELGPPGAGLDRGGARELLRIDAARERAEREVRELDGQIERAGNLSWYEQGADDTLELVEAAGLSEHEVRHYNRLRQELVQLDRWEAQLSAEGRHPAAWVADFDRVVRALAYADEVAIRREIGVRQEVEASVVEPPDHVVMVLGAAPEQEAPERAEWEALTRELEHPRIAAEAARRDGIEPPAPPDPRAQAQTDQRIDALRAARDLPSQVNEQALRAMLDPPGMGF